MIVCFSRIVDENVKKNYKTKIAIKGADDNFNRRVIEGIEENGINPILINFMPYHSFPTGKFLRYRREETHIKDRTVINVGYINLPILKTISIKNNIIKEFKKIKKEEEKINILIYDSYLAPLQAALYLKKRYTNIKTTLITPSLPGFDVPRNGIKRKLTVMLGKSALRMGKQMDSYVLITEHMKEIINKHEKPYEVIEGIIPNEDREEYVELCSEIEGKKYILYTGRLDKIYNIDKLVNCFLNFSIKDIYLVLCGVGDYVEDIKRIAKNSNRIIYLGFKNRPELNMIQKNALMLINPRSTDGIYTRYSFPSKTMEYLLTGKPVIMFKLLGVPKSYDKYLYYIDDNSEEAIKIAILNVLEDLKNGRALEKGDAGRRFVVMEKNEKNQALKILKLMERV